MEKNQREIIHKDGRTIFPWRWFIFLVACLFFGGEGIALFIFVVVFVKGFTKLMHL